ncbi:MAG: hypothetical protein ACREBV_03250, partial [Candidatus Zixiibacteriota bacterium]
MKRIVVLTAGLAALTSMAVIAGQVGPPEIVSYQARLNDNLGNPVEDGNYNIIFRIYDAPTGGNLEWAETTTVAISGGFLSVQLGSDNPLTSDIFQSIKPDLLEISVNGEALSQRTQMVSAPYSLNTGRVTGDVQTSPGEILFQGIGDPDTRGVIFQDTTTGDTIAQYGPGGIVWVQPQPEPPMPETTLAGPAGFVFKGFELFDGRGERSIGPTGDNYSLDGVPLASFDVVEGIMFADTGSGDTHAVYTSDEILLSNSSTTTLNYMRIDPTSLTVFDSSIGNGGSLAGWTWAFMDFKTYDVSDLDGHGTHTDASGIMIYDGPDTVSSYGVTGLAFGDVGPNHVRFGPGGIMMLDNSGDTTLYAAPDYIRVGRDLNDPQLDNFMVLSSSGVDLVDGASDRDVVLDVGGLTINPNTQQPLAQVRVGGTSIFITDNSGDTTLKLTSSSLEVESTLTVTGELTVDNDAGTPQVTLKKNGKIELAGNTEWSSSGLILGTLAPNRTVLSNGTFYMTNMSGDTTLRIIDGKIEAESTVTVGGDVSVEDNSGNSKVRLKNDGTVTAGGHVSVGGDAGPSTTVAIGERYRDNALVAWGRVSAAGVLTNEFGVASLAHPTTGTYTITIDDTASLAGNFIAMVVPEVDAMPGSVATVRLAYVDQNGT